MAEQKPEKRPEAMKADLGTPFKEMTTGKKVSFVVKVIICVITFGIVFPNVMSD